MTVHTINRRTVNLAFALCLGGVVLASPARQDPPTGQVQAIALVVHPDNPLRDVQYSHLKGYLKLDRQFWPKPNKSRVDLVLPPADSLAKKVLLERVYRMTEKKLKRHWYERAFNGEIPKEPRVAKTTAAVGRMVAGSKSAISAVAFDKVPKGLIVLQVDGRAPGENGYPLNVGPESAPSVRGATAQASPR